MQIKLSTRLVVGACLLNLGVFGWASNQNSPMCIILNNSNMTIHLRYKSSNCATNVIPPPAASDDPQAAPGVAYNIAFDIPRDAKGKLKKSATCDGGKPKVEVNISRKNLATGSYHTIGYVICDGSQVTKDGDAACLPENTKFGSPLIIYGQQYAGCVVKNA